LTLLQVHGLFFRGSALSFCWVVSDVCSCFLALLQERYLAALAVHYDIPLASKLWNDSWSVTAFGACATSIAERRLCAEVHSFQDFVSSGARLHPLTLAKLRCSWVEIFFFGCSFALLSGVTALVTGFQASASLTPVPPPRLDSTALQVSHDEVSVSWLGHSLQRQ